MASITDLILSQVKNVAGSVEVPSNVQNTVLQGLSDSILGGLTQTAAKPGGLDAIKSLFTGKADAATSPITALAGSLFSKNILSKLNLGNAKTLALAALIPTILSKLSNFIKDQDGDGDVDLNDILITLKGGNKTASAGSSILGAATSILGGLLKKR